MNSKRDPDYSRGQTGKSVVLKSEIYMKITQFIHQQMHIY